VLAGAFGLLYAISFIVLQNVLLSGLFLMLGGLLATAALTALFHRVREADPSLALWALGLFVIAWLIGRSAGLPKGLSYLGYLLAVLSVILYVGRLIVLSPRNPLIFVPAMLAGFVVYPLWYVWAGLVLWRGTSDGP
jgi:hypothetical protein